MKVHGLVAFDDRLLGGINRGRPVARVDNRELHDVYCSPNYTEKIGPELDSSGSGHDHGGLLIKLEEVLGKMNRLL
jgi:hypothetical protein